MMHEVIASRSMKIAITNCTNINKATMKMGTVIRVEYSRDSLGDIPVPAYEAELYDALRARWAGAHIDIVQTLNNKYWGIIDDTEIDSDAIRRISEEVFKSLCQG